MNRINMRLIAGILSLLMILPAMDSQAQSNPNHKKINSVIFLSMTNTGRTMAFKYFDTDNDLLDHYNIGDMSPGNENALFEITGSGRNMGIILNGNYLESSPEYLSWILVQALVQFDIEQTIERTGVISLPYNFIQYTQWAFLVATSHWQQLGSPTRKDMALDPKESIRKLPLATRSSSSYWDGLYDKSQSQFLNELRLRHLFLGFDNETFSGYIKRAPQKEKDALNTLKNRFEKLLE